MQASALKAERAMYRREQKTACPCLSFLHGGISRSEARRRCVYLPFGEDDAVPWPM